LGNLLSPALHEPAVVGRGFGKLLLAFSAQLGRNEFEQFAGQGWQAVEENAR